MDTVMVIRVIAGMVAVILLATIVLRRNRTATAKRVK